MSLIPDHHVIKQVVLTPKVGDPQFEHYYENDWEFGSYYVDEFRFPTNYWEVSFQVGPSKEFEEVAKIVGEDKASEVLEALGL